MSKNANFVSHKKSKQIIDGKPKLPLASDLVEGEIAINFGKDVETLSIKNESGDVVTFSSDNYYTEQKLGSGFTSSNSARTVTEALTDLDEKKLDVSAYTPSSELLWVSGSGENAVALKGGNNTASGKLSVAEGSGTTASGDYSHAEGGSIETPREVYNTIADGDYSHAEGVGTTASGMASHAEGIVAYAIGESSHAEGQMTRALGNGAHAEGQMTSAIGDYSHAEGGLIYGGSIGIDYSTTASGDFSHAEGGSTMASGYCSHSEGEFTTASGEASHAEGNITKAEGYASHAEGSYTTASGEASHAEGNYTAANGEASHAEGSETIASNASEHASGQYNVSNSATTEFGDSGNTLFSVGNGTSTSQRHNAFEIRQNGDIYIVSGNTDIKLQDHIGSVDTITAITPSNSGSTDPIATKVVAENELIVSNALTDLDERIDVLSGTVSAHTENTEIHITAAEKTKLNSITGTVGTMAYEDKSSYSSATEVNTALADKSDKSHEHGVNSISAMTGYQIAASASSISTSDTLNEAIGKLEKRLALLEAALKVQSNGDVYGDAEGY